MGYRKVSCPEFSKQFARSEVGLLLKNSFSLSSRTCANVQIKKLLIKEGIRTPRYIALSALVKIALVCKGVTETHY
jgi:hypothetical protein